MVHVFKPFHPKRRKASKKRSISHAESTLLPRRPESAGPDPFLRYPVRMTPEVKAIVFDSKLFQSKVCSFSDVG